MKQTLRLRVLLALCIVPMVAFAQEPGSYDPEDETFDQFVDFEQYSINKHQIKLGDLIIDKEDLKPQAGQIHTRGATAQFMGKLWTDGVLPIKFAKDVTENEQKRFFTACAAWESVANIDCKERTDEKRYIFVQKKKSSCYSAIGMGGNLFTKKRTLNLGENCWGKGTIIHEIGHALSLIHEHQRSDRNDYIRIAVKNVDGFFNRFNFFRIFWSKEHTAYDFNSIMHYGAYSFAKDDDKAPTIQMRPGYEQYQDEIGQRSNLSDGDKATAVELYGKK